MKKIIITLATSLAFIVGCGGGGSTQEDTSFTPTPDSETLKDLSEVHKDPLLQKVIDGNFQSLIEDSKKLSEENYITYYIKNECSQVRKRSGFKCYISFT